MGARVNRFASGDRVMALVGGGAQAELAVVDEAHALGARRPGLAGGRRLHGGVRDRLRRALRAGGPHARRPRAGDGRGRRRRHGGGAAGGVAGAASSRRCATALSTRPWPRWARPRSSIPPSAAHGPYDVVLELVGAASLPSVLAALASATVVVIGVGSGAMVEVDLMLLMGPAPSPPRRCGRGQRREGRPRRDARRAGLPALAGGRLRVPVAARSRCRTRPPPTSASPRAARSARSSSRERGGGGGCIARGGGLAAATDSPRGGRGSPRPRPGTLRCDPEEVL